MVLLSEAKITPKTVDEWLNGVDLKDDPNYVPSAWALQFVTFIKLVNGGEGEENKTPVLHLKMLDNACKFGNLDHPRLANMVFRGAAKTTVLGEYLFLYIAVFGEIPGFGKINLALYVSDSLENGVKNMRKNLEYRWENSEFLQKYLPKKTAGGKVGTNFTDMRWEFVNIQGNRFIVKGYGAKTGVRGSKELGTRPQLAVLDDLVSDEDARSPTVIATIEATVNKAVEHALHPKKSLIIWSGTPFNAKDPLYKAVESGAWIVNVYPVCERFPCTEEEFVGAWPDRFTYKTVKEKYEHALQQGKPEDFNQELMLRIMSDDERLIQEHEIQWYKRSLVRDNKTSFNYYITTDFATSAKAAADFSVISVWAYNNNGDWYWVDGVVARQDMGRNMDDLFHLVSRWKPMSVGVEVSGQQAGFIQWMQSEMIKRNIYFNFASDNNSNAPGIRPNTDKMQRFNVVVPLFKLKKIFFPEEMKSNPMIQEFMTELRLASASGFRSKHDDCIDTISMLAVMKPFAPSVEMPRTHAAGSSFWEEQKEEQVNTGLKSYLGGT